MPGTLCKVVLLACSAIVSIPGAYGEQASLSETRDAAAQLAVTTVSEKLSIDPETIDVIHVSIMDWPDSSLGCPRPGVEYLQAVTRGSLVLLRANKKAYRVHIGNNRAVICDKPLKGGLSRQPKGLSGIPVRGLMQTARQDLARRLGVSSTEVSVTRVESRTWPDAALGCPAPGQDYDETEIQGFRITLDYAGQTFSYHTDQQQAFPCPPIERE